MKPITRFQIAFFAPLLLCVLALFAQGCRGTFTVAPGADPVVVYAEATAEYAFDVFDSFLAWERGNEVALKKVDPAVHKFANDLRDHGLTWITDLRTATKAYKADRTGGKADAVKAAQTFLELACQEARTYYLAHQ